VAAATTSSRRQGADSIDGGTGIDTLLYQSGARRDRHLSSNINTGGDAAGDILTNIEMWPGRSTTTSSPGNFGDNVLSGLPATTSSMAATEGCSDRRPVRTSERRRGADLATYDSSSRGDHHLVAGTLGGDARGHAGTGIENVTGSRFADIITAMPGATTSARCRQRRAQWRAGADSLRGGAGRHHMAVPARIRLLLREQAP